MLHPPHEDCNYETCKQVDISPILTIIIVMVSQNLPFKLVYAPVVREHLEAIEGKYYSLIRDTIETQLRFEPDVETRNRKPLKRTRVSGGHWEIRFGPHNRFRVFYEVSREYSEVYILAVGEKEGNRLFIGGKEVEL